MVSKSISLIHLFFLTKVLIMLLTSFKKSNGFHLQASLNPKIAHGQPTEERQSPWQATLVLFQMIDDTLTYNSTCGGTLVDKRWVLTALDCVRDFNNSDIVIYIGLWNFSVANRYDRYAPLEAPEVHPCNSSNTSHRLRSVDLAMIQLNLPVPDSGSVACLPVSYLSDAQQLRNGIPLRNCIAAGFGRTGGGISTVLQQVRFASMSINQCQQSYGKNVVSNDKICPINEANRRISHGDIGGPLMCPTHETRCGGYYLAGVILQSNPGHPDIFLSIFSHVKWINYVIQRRKPLSRTSAILQCDSGLFPKQPTIPEGNLLSENTPS